MLLRHELNLGASIVVVQVSMLMATTPEFVSWNSPVLEPDLDRSLCHVDFLSYPVSHFSSGSRVLAEFELESRELVLGRPLPLLVLLLLGQGTLSRGPPRRGLTICRCDIGQWLVFRLRLRLDRRD